MKKRELTMHGATASACNQSNHAAAMRALHEHAARCQ